MMKMKFLNAANALSLGVTIAAGMAAFPTEARAQGAATPKSPVSLSSDVKIERTERDATGKEQTVLRAPKDVIVVPGDRVVFTLNVANTGAQAASGFRATNPIPAPVSFIEASEDWAELSVDGGKSWGKLADMTVKVKADDTGVETTRAASAEDVTHVRWVFTDAIAPATKIAVSYRGVVR